MNMHAIPQGFKPVRRDQLREEREHDSYKMRQKPAEPAVCGDCGAVFHAGRWQWSERPADANEVVCPACARTHDRYPAGFVHLGGPFLAEHRDEVTALLRHREEREKAAHPLARIMAIEPENGGLLVTTTDLHLARDLGEALHHAYRGELEFHYNESEKLLRVHWQR
ncbi:BCAM0308 family protein [Azospira restricta]|uniref:ATPase n=1 Tax=Azospira restricta TaxID=404405 RepID=A0A974SML6_9RHOO|nr:BCAM0308 family protein [Azospira restricta]QRJ62572.1 ATPase [Azospira restricta]